jgi:hypothetical protein
LVSLLLLASLLLLESLFLLVTLLWLKSLLLKVFPSVLELLSFASTDVPVVSCASVAPPVAVVHSAVNVLGVSAVVRVSALEPLILWASVLLPASPLGLTCVQLLVFPPGSGTPAVVPACCCWLPFCCWLT